MSSKMYPTNVTALSISTVAAISSTAYSDTVVGVTLTPTDGKVFYGASGVTTSNGQPLESGQSLFIQTDDPRTIFLVASTGTVNVRLTIWKGSLS